MWSLSVISLLVSGVAYASGSPCDSGPAAVCYADLLHYESLAFPLYGRNEAALDDTCEDINMLFECLSNYTETCQGKPECDEECRNQIYSIHISTLDTGLRNLAAELCSTVSPIRESYLENYHCLESNADVYSACHNVSKMSIHYINSLEDPSVIPLICCYFSWYRGCFENATRDNCGVNATSFVSFAMRELTGHITDQVCKEIDSFCERPPLPTSVNEDENKENLDEGVTYGSPCDGASATKCLSELGHYETSVFPLYGEGEAELDDTCEDINMLFECVFNYTETCYSKPECDQECRDLIYFIKIFTMNTGLRNLATELCSAFSPVRQTYLETYHCLESNADVYSACHNDSKMSLDYLTSLEGPTVIPMVCCYLAWYRDCFVNATRDNCGVDATFYVSFAMRKRTGHIADQHCQEIDSSCERPPLPTIINEDESELDKEKSDKTNDDLDSNINNDSEDSTTAANHARKEKPDKTNYDLDNSTNNDSKGLATVANRAVMVLVLSYTFVLLSERLLSINYFI